MRKWKTELSERQMEILLMAAEGMHNEEIAHRLRCSSWTVKDELASMGRKWQVKGRVALVAAALRNDVIA